MEISLYQIDAFASQLFEGNPAAVCPLDEWLPDEVMQSIAEENNLSETAFFVPSDEGFHIRWFTPKSEVDLCGHATLASAYVLFNILGYEKDRIEFESRSGILTVTRENEWLVMDFPAQPPIPCDIPPEIVAAFDTKPVECLKAEDYCKSLICVV
jgi:PhzF family phenazine biosynthesis protein